MHTLMDRTLIRRRKRGKTTKIPISTAKLSNSKKVQMVQIALNRKKLK